MPTFEEIYAQHGDVYDALVSREDYENNLFRTMDSIKPLSGADVVEFGAGTGRLTRLLVPAVKSIRAYDSSAHMLDVARRHLTDTGLDNWTLDVATNESLPVEDVSADIVLEGWSFGHAVGWFPDRWHEEIGSYLAEMTRILRPGGVAILIETMGTGSETPAPPTEGLAELYRWWEDEQRFESTSIRTDYRFMNLAEADTLARFFFGDDLADRIVRDNLMILPECTGIWWKFK